MPGHQTIVLHKNTHSATDDLAPGEYSPCFRGRGYGDKAWVSWKCPECRQSLLLLRSVHTVDFEGVVSPGVRCPDEDCLFHVELADWVPEPVGHA